MIRNESYYIYKLIDLLTFAGVKVNLFAGPLYHGGSGMYRSETKEIFVNEPNALSALMVLAHEAGHWMGYAFKEMKHSYQRERQACVYGWKILVLIGASSIITRKQWFEREKLSYY